MGRSRQGRCAVAGHRLAADARRARTRSFGSARAFAAETRRRKTARMTFLGIDLGTSALKAVLVDEAQAVLAEAAVPLRTSAPRPGWSEQDPEDWWGALRRPSRVSARPGRTRCATCAPRPFRPDARRRAPRSRRRADPAGDPVERRARRRANATSCIAAVPDLREIAGIVAMPGFTAPKLLWLKRHEPESFARICESVSARRIFCGCG